jgi:uncharacterized membrane protein YphA (DoxX/SURF4 family)
MHIPAPLAFLAICAEFFEGLGLIIGFLTRIAVPGIATNMIVAIATFLMLRRAGAFSVDRAPSTKAPSDWVQRGRTQSVKQS